MDIFGDSGILASQHHKGRAQCTFASLSEYGLTDNSLNFQHRKTMFTVFDGHYTHIICCLWTEH